MRKIFTTTFALVFGIGIISTQAQIESYQQAPDFGGGDYLNAGLGASNGSAYFAGSSDATGAAGGYDVMLTRVDPEDGSVTWAKQYGGAGGDFARYIHEDPSGNLLVVGSTDSDAPDGFTDFGVTQFDSDGNVNWSKSLGTDTTDFAWAVADGNDGGYLVGGHTQPNNRTSILLTKLQSNGTVDWTKTIGSTFGNERLYDIRALGTGEGYLLVGYTGLYGATWNEAMVMKISDSGDLEATFTFGGPSNTDDDARAYVEGTGSFFITGNTRSFGAGGQDLFVAKMDNTPSIVWFKTYGGADNEDFADARILDDGLMLMLGHTNSFGTNGEGLLIAIDTADGSTLLSYTYGGGQDEWLNSIVDAGGILLGGYSESFGADADGYFVKLGESGATSCNNASLSITAADQQVSLALAGQGDFTSAATTLDNDITTTPAVNTMTSTPNQLCITVGINDAGEQSSIEVYPVPANDFINVKGLEAGTYQATIFSVDGRMVSSEVFSGSSTQLSISNLKAGAYVLEVSGSNGSWTSRVLKN